MATLPLADFCRRNRVFGCLAEIDYRTNVGTPAWQERHPPRIRKLSAWRRAHDLRTHSGVKREMHRRGFAGPQTMTPRDHVKLVEFFEQRDEITGR